MTTLTDTAPVTVQYLIPGAASFVDSMASDLHSLGKVLDKKYRLLWISYTVFMGGLVLSVLLLAVLFIAQDGWVLLSGQ